MLSLIRIVTFMIVVFGAINCINIRWGEETDTGHWGSKHRISFHFAVGGKQYFFGMTDISGGKYWFIQELGENGKMKSETSTGTWNFFYINIFPFTINDKQYIYGISGKDHRNYWFIQEILPGGIMGAETDSGFWKSKPTVIFPYGVGGGQYVYTISDRNWFITQLLPDGKMGGETDSGSWQFYYTLGFPFSINGNTYFYCISDNYWFIQELLPYGQMGIETDNGHWTTTHKIYVPFNIDDKYYFYGVTSKDYNTHTHWFIQELLPKGRMGAQKAQGTWQFYYDVSFAFQIEGKQFMYGHSAYEKYWFIQEIIQDPRLPAMITRLKEEYCNDNNNSRRRHRRQNNSQPNQNVPAALGGLNAIEARISQIEADTNNYLTLYFTDPNTPLRSVSTERVFADANHNNYADLTIAMRAEIHYNHLISTRDRRIEEEVYNHLRDLDRENDDEAGHLLASSLGGPAVPFNFAPQSPLVNRAVRVRGSMLPQSGWYALENLLREFLLEVGDSGFIRWAMAIRYGHLPDSRRPTDFYLSVRFYDDRQNLMNWRGHGAIREYVFPNVPTVACLSLNNNWWNQ